MYEYYIYLFGKFNVLNNKDQHIPAFNKSNVQQLLSYLILNRSCQHTREALAASFWPDVTPTQSKAYLRKALWQLQCAFNNNHLSNQTNPIVVVENEWIYLNPTANIWLDVSTLEHAFKKTEGISGEALSEKDLEIAKGGILAYRGELLAGWAQEWCLQERERLQQFHIILLDKLVNNCLYNQRFELGLNYAIDILKQDPARERTHRALMYLYYMAGDRTAALRQYAICTNILREELDVQPSTRTQSLYEALCADQAEKIWNGKTLSTPKIDTEPLLDTLLSLKRTQTDLYTVQNRIDREIANLTDLIEKVNELSSIG
jgi:DNA-binding SARP family transcriptional activator